MEEIVNSEFLLRENESHLCALERIRAHSHFPYLKKSDIVNLVKFLNKTSIPYSRSDIKYELYLLFISYHLLPSPYATCRIGEIYMFGLKKKKEIRMNPINNIRCNYRKAIEYLTLSSTYGYSKANYLLGTLYLRKKDYNYSIYYLELSASVCYPDALLELGMLYYHGTTEIQQNFQKAYKYFEHSAHHGNTLGIFMLRNFGDSIKSQYVSQRIDEMGANGMRPIIQGECPVCFDQKIGYTLPCNDKHFVCCECLGKLLTDEILASGQIKCPLCRAQS